MSLNKYLERFRKALEKFEDYGFLRRRMEMMITFEQVVETIKELSPEQRKIIVN